MPVRFRILTNHALVLVRYEGVATVRESFDAFEDFVAHPEFDPNHRHLVDLSHLAMIRMDFPTLFRFQARKAEVFLAAERPVMMVYHAPCSRSLPIARQLQRSWEGLDAAVACIATDWPGAMDILGLRREAFGSVLAEEA